MAPRYIFVPAINLSFFTPWIIVIKEVFEAIS